MTATPNAIPRTAQAPAEPPALTSAQVEELRVARLRLKRVRRAVNYALFDAWGVAIFAGLTILGSLLDPAGLPLGLGMAAIAFVEFRQAARLRRLEPDAAKILALNQLAFAGLLIGYACWRIYVTLTGPEAFAEEMQQNPMIADMLRPYAHLAKQLSLLVYGSLIAASIAVQGGTAVFYFTRAKHVRAAQRETPAWILALQRAGVTI
jgi:hypothetical protein